MFTLRTQLGNANKGPRPAWARYIVIHHWGDPAAHRNVKPAAIASFLNRPGGNSSAHAVVGPWEVIQICPWQRIAWHAPGGNAYGIGLELKPFDSQTPKEEVDAIFETTAWLIAYLWHVCPGLDRKLRWHKQFYNTACPAEWIARISDLEKRAAEYYPKIDPNNPTATKPLTERKEPPKMICFQYPDGRCVKTDGIFYNYIGDPAHLQALMNAGVPLISATPDQVEAWYLPAPNGLETVPGRVKDLKDMATDFPGMSDSLKRTSVLAKIQATMGIPARQA
ncbi:peptidoglycan recognition family protein [Mobiluncus porci]|uniref:N-acetylmuramoyl-L-alanine amidase n=1 Tax=Mobiluncus porci TaxID=2652278 RepID=A0A7K0K206_9ACTO|nr:peptidoglycan recognition family protein [Mobiluncus porci]MST49502.1 N-acetylmuramoyl-L-alanine amidase [Mobiluncus porci]